jgi:alpha-glucuronidase
MKKFLWFSYFLFAAVLLKAEDGYRLWLRYDKINDPALLQQYRNNIAGVNFSSPSPTLSVAKQELINDLQSLLDKKISDQNTPGEKFIVAGTPATSEIVKQFLSSGNFNLGKILLLLQPTMTLAFYMECLHF